MMRSATDAWAAMTRRQREACASMILTITVELECIVWFDGDEVTVQAGHGCLDHAHHRGSTLYTALQKAVESARQYASDRTTQATEKKT
jgi:hypothetical protein